MQNKLFKFLIPLTLIFFNCAAGLQKSPSFPVDEHTRIYEVFGMDCPGCHGGVEKLINRISGVTASEANWRQQRLWVQVESDADVSDDDIISAITEANFTVGRRIQ